MIKRSHCQCVCHTDAYMLGKITAPMHVIPCCENDICVIDDIGDKMTSDEEMMLACEEYKKKQIINDILGKDIFNSINKDIMKAVEVYSTHVAILYWNAAIKIAADMCDYPDTADRIRKLKKDVTD